MQETLTKKLTDVFLQYGILKKYNAGQLLVERGQAATKNCFIVKGQARTFCSNSAGEDITLFYIEAHNLICSEAFIPHAVVNVSVQAITSVEMYVLPREHFLQIWVSQGNAIEELFEPLVTRLTLLSDYICCAHFKENKKKVAYFLHSCCLRTGTTITYTNEQIADITGINRVSVNRILNTFAKGGILELSYKKIKLLDAQRLAQVFNSVGYFID